MWGQRRPIGLARHHDIFIRAAPAVDAAAHQDRRHDIRQYDGHPRPRLQCAKAT